MNVTEEPKLGVLGRAKHKEQSYGQDTSERGKTAKFEERGGQKFGRRSDSKTEDVRRSGP